MEEIGFEKLEVWKNGGIIANRVYDLSSKGEFSRDFALKSQIRNAGISIISNISEGYERGGDKENLQFLSYAKGSAGEARSQLFLALDKGYISKTDFEEVYQLLLRGGKMLSGLMGSIKKSGYKGNKFVRK